MPTLWEQLADSFTSVQQKNSIQATSFEGQFSGFTGLAGSSIEDVSNVLEQQVVNTLPTHDNYMTFLCNDFTTKVQQVLSSCEEGSLRLEQLTNLYPGNMQESTAFVIDDMIEQGVIDSIYDLSSTGAYLMIKDYFNSYQAGSQKFPLCAHPFVRSASENILENASHVIEKNTYVYPLSFQIAYTGLSAAQGYSSENLSIVIHTANADPYASMIYSGQPSANGIVTFNYEVLLDDVPQPATFSGYMTPIVNGIFLGAIPLSIATNGGSVPTVLIGIPPEVSGGFIADDNTVDIDTLTSDIHIAVALPSSLQSLLNNNNINTLADIRSIGGLNNWTLISTIINDPGVKDAIEFLDSHARLELLTLIRPVAGSSGTKSFYVSQAFYQAGLLSARDVAEMPLADVVKIAKTFVSPL